MKMPDWKSRSPRQRKIIRRGVWALAIYAIIGFLILPPIVRRVAVSQLTKQLGRTVSIETLRLNPFALSATVRGFRIADPDGQMFVAWDEVYVNFEIASLFSKAWIFHEVSTTTPYIRVQINPDSTLNFSDLVTKFSLPSAVPKPPAAPLALRIGKLHIAGATAAYKDLTMKMPFKRVVGPLDMTLLNFRTDPDNKNPYSFAGTTDAGERFSWSGYFSLDPLRSRGELALENISLNKYAPLYQDFFRLEIRDGKVGVRASYDLELSAAHRVMAVSNAAFELRSLKIAAPGSSNNLVELARFNVSGANVDAVAHTADIGAVAGYGGRLVLKRDASAAINVVELAKPAPDAAASGGILLLLRSVTNAVALLLNSTNQWAGTIRSVNLWENSLSLEDLVNSRPARLEIDSFELAATNLSNLPGTNLTAALALRWNTNGSVKIGASASFTPPTVDVDLAIDGLDLHPLDPYLESQVNVIVLGSRLGLHGQLRLHTGTNGLPDVSFAGDTSLEDFSTVDGVLGEDLLAWKSVRISGINANLSPPEVAIAEIAVADATARVVIETNRTINLLAALNIVDTNVPAIQKSKLPRPATKERGEGRGEGQSSKKTSSPQPSPLSGEEREKATPIALPKISVARVSLTNVQAQFTDRSIQPAVRFAVRDLSGTIAGLSSDAAQSAAVDLRANVNGGAPATITGTLNPLAKIPTGDLKIAMQGLDLTPASPYAGRFAGYRIAKGKLAVDLAYNLAAGQLKAANVITLDQFTFGEKVESPDATKLPVRLAIAILKDRDGKILLDVPIEGSLDDPQFHLGKVVTRAILNIIVKIATSPFSVLGAIFGGGGEEMGWQDFPAGQAELSGAEKTKLDGLIKGLYERPALQVAIAGSVDPVTDLAALRRIRLEEQLRRVKWQSLRAAARASVKPEDLTLAADERADLVKEFYRQTLAAKAAPVTATNRIQALAATGTNRVVAAAVAPPKYQSASLAKGAQTMMAAGDVHLLKAATASGAATVAPGAGGNPAEVLEQAALATIPVGDADFAALAAARAQAVKAYLLQSGQVMADRIFLTENPETKTEGSRTYLELQ